MKRGMPLFFGGLLLGIFLCISFFEILHRDVELTVEEQNLCSVLMSGVTGLAGKEITYGLRIVYKAFAFPAKQLYLNFSPGGDLLDIVEVVNGWAKSYRLDPTRNVWRRQ